MDLILDTCTRGTIVISSLSMEQKPWKSVTVHVCAKPILENLLLEVIYRILLQCTCSLPEHLAKHPCYSQQDGIFVISAAFLQKQDQLSCYNNIDAQHDNRQPPGKESLCHFSPQPPPLISSLQYQDAKATEEEYVKQHAHSR